MIPYQNCRYKKALRGGVRACNNLPQPNPYILVFEGCGRLLHALTPPRSAFLYLKFWHGVIPTSYFIFNDFYTCNSIAVYVISSSTKGNSGKEQAMGYTYHNT